MMNFISYLETTAPIKMVSSLSFAMLVVSTAAIKTEETLQEGRVDSVDKNCPSNAPCVAYSSCPSAMTMFLELSKMERKSKEYLELASNIQGQVCNKKEKGVCCVDTDEATDCVMMKKGYAEGDKIAWSPSFQVKCKHGKMVLQARHWQEVFGDTRIDTP